MSKKANLKKVLVFLFLFKCWHIYVLNGMHYKMTENPLQ